MHEQYSNLGEPLDLSFVFYLNELGSEHDFLAKENTLFGFMLLGAKLPFPTDRKSVV